MPELPSPTSISRNASDGATLRFSVGYFVLFAVYGVSSPYLQLLIRGLGYSPSAVGLLLGIFEIAGALGPLLIGAAADRSGRYRPALLATALLTAAALPLLVLSPGIAPRILAIVLLSLGLKSLVPLADTAAFAHAAALGRPEGPGGAYGRMRAIGSAGFVAMALALQAVPNFDRSSPGRIALILGASAVAFALCVLFIPESGKGRGKSAMAATAGRKFDPVFALGLLVIALGRIAMAPVSSFLSLYVVEEIRWNAVGGLWAIAALSEIPLLVFSGRIVARFGAMRVISFSSVAIALRLALYALFPTRFGVVAAQLLHSLCFGLFHPAAVAFVATRVPPERRAVGMAAYIGLGIGLPSFFGSALGGLIVEAWGYRALFGSFIVFAAAALGLYAAARKRFD